MRVSRFIASALLMSISWAAPQLGTITSSPIGSTILNPVVMGSTSSQTPLGTNSIPTGANPATGSLPGMSGIPSSFPGSTGTGIIGTTLPIRADTVPNTIANGQAVSIPVSNPISSIPGIPGVSSPLGATGIPGSSIPQPVPNPSTATPPSSSPVGVPGSGTCRIPGIRKEWRQLSKTEQNEFLDAVTCLKQQRPSRLAAIYVAGGPPAPQSRYDDFVWIHWTQFQQAHQNAGFLPFHRNLIHLFELALQRECNYRGTLPYWDWTSDSADTSQAPVWNDDSFGGNGQLGGDPTWPCIATSRFNTWVSQYQTPRCIARSFNFSRQALWSYPAVEFVLGTSLNYQALRTYIEYGPHAYLHNAIGGTQMELTVATNDPIFWLHHANIDRLWSRWQTMHPNLARDYADITPQGQPSTPSQILNISIITPGERDYTVAEIMDTMGGSPLCYQYSAPPRTVAERGPQFCFPRPENPTQPAAYQDMMIRERQICAFVRLVNSRSVPDTAAASSINPTVAESQQHSNDIQTLLRQFLASPELSTAITNPNGVRR